MGEMSPPLYSPDSIAMAATIFARFGIESLSELRSTRADRRAHFLAGAKKSCRSKSTKMAHELFATSPALKKGRDLASVDFDEIQIPRRLKSLQLDCSAIAGTPRPAQEMVSAIAEDIARVAANPQPLHPYIIPNYPELPWLPRIAAHITAYNTWEIKRTGPKKFPPLCMCTSLTQDIKLLSQLLPEPL